jgi:hypothetical protein
MNPIKTLFSVLLTFLLVLSGWEVCRGAALTGENVVNAVKAVKGKSPSPEEKKALATVTENLTTAIFQKLGINPSTAPRDDVEELRGISLLTLKVLDAMTGDDQATLRKMGLNDLLAVAQAVMIKVKELKVTDIKLKDEKYLQETFFPGVIDYLANPR